MVSFGKNPDAKYVSPIRPLAETGGCSTASSNTYGTIDPIDKYPAHDPPPDQHPDLNITAIRGYVPAGGEKYPLVLGEAGDPKAPQIWKITDKIPEIVSLYKVNSWDWNTNRKGPPMPLPDDPAASVKPISMIGLRTTPGEVIKVPNSGYIIGGNYQVMVIFANNNNITVKYGREDNIGIKFGYAVQIEGTCVDPNLLNLYNQLNSAGRNDLPALTGGQVLGTANGNEIRVVIRDTGDFLDPRSKLDWWQGVDYPYTPPPNPPTIIPTKPLPSVPLTTPVPTASPFVPSITTIPNVSAVPTTPIIPTAPPQQPTLTNPSSFPTLTIPAPTSIPPSSTPTLTPTPAPIIDLDKSVENIKFIWKKLLIHITNLSKSILP